MAPVSMNHVAIILSGDRKVDAAFDSDHQDAIPSNVKLDTESVSSPDNSLSVSM